MAARVGQIEWIQIKVGEAQMGEYRLAIDWLPRYHIPPPPRKITLRMMGGGVGLTRYCNVGNRVSPWRIDYSGRRRLYQQTTECQRK